MGTWVTSCAHGVWAVAVHPGVLATVLEGGVFAGLNLLCLLGALAVSVERLYVIGVQHSPRIAAPFLEQIEKLVGSGNIDRALRVCAATPDLPLAKVVRAGLANAGKGEAARAQAVDAAILALSPVLTARVAWLWAFANAAIAIAVFGALVRLGPALHAADRGDAVSGAIHQLGLGVAIAVACVAAHALLTAQARRTLGSVERAALRLEGRLGRRTEAVAPIERPA